MILPEDFVSLDELNKIAERMPIPNGPRLRVPIPLLPSAAANCAEPDDPVRICEFESVEFRDLYQSVWRWRLATPLVI